MTPDRPPPTTPNLMVDNIPQELRDRNQWVAWKYEPRGGKWTKVPYDVQTGGRADSSGSATWSSFEDAIEAARRSDFDGIGFVFSSDDPYVGIDLDDCMGDDGVPTPAAAEIVSELASYAEVSPSGRGLKIWTRGSLPTEKTGRKTRKTEGFGGIEMYQRGRFFTMTGWPIDETRRPIVEANGSLSALFERYFGSPEPMPARQPAPAISLSDDELIARARRAANGEKFWRLWNGDTSEHGGDDSAADLALLCILAFWTGCDEAWMERLFSRSVLGQREKWESRQDYRERSIQAAIRNCHTTYSASPASRTEDAQPPPHCEHDGTRIVLASCRRARHGVRRTVRLEIHIDGRASGIETTTTTKGVGDAARCIADAIQENGGTRPKLLGLWRARVAGLFTEENLVEAERRSPVASEDKGGRNAILVASEFLQQRFDLRFKDPDGTLWSETEGRAFKIVELQAIGGKGLLDALTLEAAGFSGADEALTATRLRQTETIGRAGFGEIFQSMPSEEAADLGADSAAADRLREQITEALDAHQHRVGIRTPHNETQWRSSSLMGVVREHLQRQDTTHSRRQDANLTSWRRMHPGFDAWWKVAPDHGLRIAVRHQLLAQVRPVVSGPRRTARALGVLARRYKLVAPEKVTIRDVEGGVVSALELTPTFVRELMSSAANEHELQEGQP